jgi:hypothetical protein
MNNYEFNKKLWNNVAKLGNDEISRGGGKKHQESYLQN